MCADNITVTSGTGVTIAADDNGGALHQWVKIEVGGDGSFVPVTTANGLPVQILSLPAFAVGSSVAITSLPDLGLGSSVKITSLPDLGLGSTVKITSLPDLGLNSSVKITSLPPLGAAVVSINNFTFIPTITNLASSPLTVSGTTIAITSLPDLGLNSSVKITSLPDLGLNSVVKITSLPPLGAATVSVNNFTFVLSVTNAGVFPISSLPALAFGQSVTITNGAILSITNLVPVIVTNTTYRLNISTASPISGVWNVTTTFTSAQTNILLLPLSGSTTAHHLTDIMFSNNSTHGNMSIIESPSNAGIRMKIDRMFFVHNGGAVMNLSTPMIFDTNSAICFTSRSCTAHSVSICGYTQ